MSMVNSIHQESSTQIILKILWYMYIIIQKSNYMHTSYIFCIPKIRLDKVVPTINEASFYGAKETDPESGV